MRTRANCGDVRGGEIEFSRQRADERNTLRVIDLGHLRAPELVVLARPGQRVHRCGAIGERRAAITHLLVNAQATKDRDEMDAGSGLLGIRKEESRGATERRAQRRSIMDVERRFAGPHRDAGMYDAEPHCTARDHVSFVPEPSDERGREDDGVATRPASPC